METVAPYAGAWIETLTLSLLVRRAMVAPYAGAWIETSWAWMHVAGIWCRALRGRVD